MKKIKANILRTLCLTFLLISCDNQSEWIYLFDGKTTDGWRAYNGTDIPEKWAVVDGELTFNTELKLEEDWVGGADIIYFKEQFENFELHLEWKLPKGGNSGVFYHVQEGYDSPPAISPEFQLLDDIGWEEINNAKLKEWQKAGANYAMHEVDISKKKLNPAGQWNSSKIIFSTDKVEHWLNGQLLLDFVPYSEDWTLKRNSGRVGQDYAKYKKGYIALQDHDSPIWFRNIKIRKL